METKNIHQCLAAIMRSVEAVGKSKTNTMQNFKYRGIDDVMNALHAAFAAEGVVIRLLKIESVERVERPTKNGGMMLYTVNDYTFAFSAPDGSEVMGMSRGEAQDSADKSSNKAVSVALKYALLQMFLIPTEEMAANEADARGVEIAPKQQQKAAPAPMPRVEPEDDRAEEKAIAKIREAKTVTELEGIWKGFSTALKKTEIIRQETKTRGEQLSPAASSDQ